MKPIIVKNILSFLELDDYITEIASNQTKILTYLENMQDSQTNNTNLIDKNTNTNQNVDYNFKNIIYYTIGAICVIGIIYYFTSGDDNGEALTNIYENINQEILQKIKMNNTIVNNNMKYMLDTIVSNDNHLVDVMDRLFIKNNVEINKIISIRLFNAILKNGRHLEDITKMLEGLTSNDGVATTHNLKKIVFADES